MHVFISAGEPSGDLHAGNLLKALRHHDPSISCAGYGGSRLAAAGGEILFPLTNLSVMWFLHAVKSYRTFSGLIDRADAYFRAHRPAAVILVDYPGLHWWLARRARARGIPVVYFVPPQLWAWGGWRVAKMRRFVDHVICSLPFEPDWYRQRGITAHYFGHPYFDELQRQSQDQAFLAGQQRPGRPIVAVLPGSREQEVRMNWPSFQRALSLISVRRPDARFLVAAFNDRQKAMIESSRPGAAVPLEVHVGRTAEIIRVAEACLSVSGSVGLELLNGLLPSVVCYRIRPIGVPFVRTMMNARFISLVNLLAGEELLPEFLTARCPAVRLAEQIVRWLDDPRERSHCRERLGALRDRVARPGACASAAEFIVQAIGRPRAAA